MKNNINELEALNNACSGTDLKVCVYYQNDSRKKNTYFVSIDNVSISPCLDYTKLNYFILGYLRCLNRIKKESKELIKYKLRAECEYDIELFYNENKDVIYNLQYEEVFCIIDVVVTFESYLSLDQIISLMKQQPDTHVMRETVKPIKEYTGIRV